MHIQVFMLLKNFHEIYGVLKSIEDNDRYFTLVITPYVIDVPKDIPFYTMLRSLIGETIGLFNCDGEYKLRRIPRTKGDINRKHHNDPNSSSDIFIKKYENRLDADGKTPVENPELFQEKYNKTVTEVNGFLQRQEKDKYAPAVLEKKGDEGK